MSDLEDDLVELKPVRLCKHAGAKIHEIWEPRYHDKRVLIACHKVGEHNLITFTKAKSVPGWYYVSGKTARKYKKVSNGTIDCFPVRLSDLEPFEPKERCEHEL